MSETVTGTGQSELVDRLAGHEAVDAATVRAATVTGGDSRTVTQTVRTEVVATEASERVRVPRSEYEAWARERVPRDDRYDHPPEDRTETTIPFVETGCPVETCPDCDGAGERSCRTCSGRGTVDCRTCDGTRRVSCDACDGTGMDWDEGPCWECSGNGDVECEACYDGTESCRSCHGSGTATCGTCSGEGQTVTAVAGTVTYTPRETTTTEPSAFPRERLDVAPRTGEHVGHAVDDSPPAGDGDGRVVRTLTDRYEFPATWVQYELDDRSFVSGVVDGDLRLGAFPHSDRAIDEALSTAVDEGVFTYSPATADDRSGLTRVVRGTLAALAGVTVVTLAAVAFTFLADALPGGVVVSNAVLLGGTGVVAALFGRRVVRRHAAGSPVASRLDLAVPLAGTAAVLAALGLGAVGPYAGLVLAGLLTVSWTEYTTRRLSYEADRAAFLVDTCERFLADGPAAVDRADVLDRLSAWRATAPARPRRLATAVGVVGVGGGSVIATGTLVVGSLGALGGEPNRAAVEPLARIGGPALALAVPVLCGLALLFGTRLVTDSD